MQITTELAGRLRGARLLHALRPRLHGDRRHGMLTITRAQELGLILTDAGMTGAAEEYPAAGVGLEIVET